MLNAQMPIITVIGFFIILAIFLIMKSMEKELKSAVLMTKNSIAWLGISPAAMLKSKKNC